MKVRITQLFTLVLLGLTVVITSCEAPKAFPCEKGVGERVTEERGLDPFTKIVLDAPADVYITEGAVFNVSITGQENVLETIETVVASEMLEISNNRCIRQSKTIEINITVPSLSLIEVKGSGDVYGMNRFSADMMELVVSGSGSIEWTTDANTINTEIRGSGDIVLTTSANEISSKLLGSGDLKVAGDAVVHHINVDAAGSVAGFELETGETHINIAGSGNCEVNVADQLGVKIVGAGSVYYKGNPSVNVNITGSGKLVDAN